MEEVIEILNRLTGEMVGVNIQANHRRMRFVRAVPEGEAYFWIELEDLETGKWRRTRSKRVDLMMVDVRRLWIGMEGMDGMRLEETTEHRAVIEDLATALFFWECG